MWMWSALKGLMNSAHLGLDSLIWVLIWKAGDCPSDYYAWHDRWEDHEGNSYPRFGSGSCWLSDHITAGCQVHGPAIYGVPGQEQPVQGYCCGSSGTRAKLLFSLMLKPSLLGPRGLPASKQEECTQEPPPHGFLTRTRQHQAGARQTSLPDPTSQTNNSQEKTFTISVFIHLRRTPDYCSISGRAEQKAFYNSFNQLWGRTVQAARVVRMRYWVRVWALDFKDLPLHPGSAAVSSVTLSKLLDLSVLRLPQL